jgi:hypothetical protein
MSAVFFFLVVAFSYFLVEEKRSLVSISYADFSSDSSDSINISSSSSSSNSEDVRGSRMRVMLEHQQRSLALAPCQQL